MVKVALTASAALTGFCAEAIEVNVSNALSAMPNTTSNLFFIAFLQNSPDCRTFVRPSESGAHPWCHETLAAKRSEENEEGALGCRAVTSCRDHAA
jgi:hypothetical protein